MPASMPAELGVVYNSAVKETSMHETGKIVDFILLHQEPEGVVIGLDFLAFSTHRYRFYDFDQSKLNSQQSLLSFVPYLASKQTVSDSVATLKANIYNDADSCEKSGFDDQREVLPEPNDIFAKVLGRYRQDPMLYAAFALSDDHLSSFSQALVKLTENRVVSYLFISPIHANQLIFSCRTRFV